MAVRSLEAGDVDAFLAWRGGDPYMDTICRHDVADHFAGGRVLLVAAEGRVLVGTLQLVFWCEESDLADGRTSAYLQALEVCPEYRRQGVGTQLVQAAEAEAARRGFERVTVMVEPGNAPSLVLFGRTGYAEFKRSTYVWRGRVYPTVCLEKRLPA